MAPRPEVGTESSHTLGTSVSSSVVKNKTFSATFSNISLSLLDEKTLSKDGVILPSYSTVDLVKEAPDPEDDPWHLPELEDTGVKWSGEADLPHITPINPIKQISV